MKFTLFGTMTELAYTRETGSWRVKRPVINLEECKKCWICVEYCPDGVVLKRENGPEIDYTFCKGCGVCCEECNAKAITMVLEED